MSPESSDGRDLRRSFRDREELIDYLRQQFPEAAAVDPQVSTMRGGYQAAIAQLDAINPLRYGKTRNFLDGAVTRLSPYIRHGVLSLATVRDRVLSQIRQRSDGEKLITELAWRDYWQRLYWEWGDRIWRDREPYKTGWNLEQYGESLPTDLQTAATGLACMDRFSRELQATGYLHNHARMWLAAYLVHWRRIRWQAGARWFLQHLLDGDPASNNLSWQWVASTFSTKPYWFNRENLQRYNGDRDCQDCPSRDRCPFDGSYDDLADQLFPNAEFRDQPRQGGRWHRDRSHSRQR